MKNPRLAGRYAKSLLDAAIEQNQLDTVRSDIKVLQSIAKTNPDFVALLMSPVIAKDKKIKIVNAVLTGKISNITLTFMQLLINKAREYNLPEINTAFTEQYNKFKNIEVVKISTAVPVSEEFKIAVINKIKRDTDVQNIELETVVDVELIGGIKIEMRGNLVDSTILRDMKDLKKH